MTTAVNLSWNWVVEALGNSEQVDPSILTDLVKRAPGISDYWGNNAREIVFLRILESLIVNGSDTATDTSFAAAAIDARIGFDSTQSCEDVHRHILNEMSPSSRTNKLERSKWDLQPLIAQKRASFTKCAPEQLKEQILTGRHPLLASLKERSGLIGGDESEKRNSMVFGKEICLNPGIGVGQSEEGLSNLLHDIWVRNKSVTEISGHPSLGHKNKVIDGCDLPSNESNLVSNLEADSVFLKQSITSVASQETASQETETREDPSGGCVQHTQSQERNLPKELLMDGLEGSMFPDGCDDEHVALENIGQCCSVGDERTALLSSQCAHPEDSLETIDSTGINLCIYCNEGGQMLVCSSNACPLVIHVSCLSTAATFDANQHFYCPSCAYFRAILEYNKAKRKSSLARNNLDTFLGLWNKCRETKPSKGISRSVQYQPREENLAILLKTVEQMTINNERSSLGSLYTSTQLTSSTNSSGTTVQASILLQLLQIIVAMLIMDTWQYFVHRYMHQNKFLYRHIHSQHHKLVVPYAIGALYNHPLEGLLLDTFGGAISFLVSGMSSRTSVIFFCFATVKTVDDHCGLWLPGNLFHMFFQNNSAYHDIHHQLHGLKYNYSQPFFPIWDKLLGTHMPYRLVKRAEGGFEAKLVKKD